MSCTPNMLGFESFKCRICRKETAYRAASFVPVRGQTFPVKCPKCGTMNEVAAQAPPELLPDEALASVGLDWEQNCEPGAKPDSNCCG